MVKNQKMNLFLEKFRFKELGKAFFGIGIFTSNIFIPFSYVQADSRFRFYKPSHIAQNVIPQDKSRRLPKAPPLGDMAVGEIFINSRGFVDIPGPKTSITLIQADPIDSLLTLSKIGNYGFLYVPDNNNESVKTKNTDITLSFKDESYQKVLNSILLASGLQGKQEGNILMVGKNILSKSFGPQISKVYRLNQTSASSAADYLGSLGADMKKVWTKTNLFNGSENTNGIASVSSGSNVQEIVSYSSNTGPLRGLIGTTDSRLQTITLIGDPYLVSIAEKYLKQLDLRQRQVALSVKVIDVLLNNTTDMKNSFEYGIGDNYIINSESGGLQYMFGNKSFSPTDFGINDSFTLASRKFMGWFRSKVITNNAKILANPTLILGETQEEVIGGSDSASDGFSDGSIGRPYANEGFVKVGTSVVTSFNVTPQEDGSNLCEAQREIAGITFGAKVHKIDDNGYVTFSLSPNITAVSETQSIGDCGNASTLSIRRLDTGTIRVRDGDTLVLTGVIKEDDTKAITKTPILGDIPILGRLFRTNSTIRKKSELIIMVTPKVIRDSLTNTAKINLKPVSNMGR